MISDALVWAFEPMLRLDWIEIAKIIVTLLSVAASFGTLAIAYHALKNWQRQDRAKREVEFLDLLVDASHAYIALMARPVELVRMCRIGIVSHTPLFDDRDEGTKLADGAVPYIHKRGEQDAGRLRAALDETRPASITLRSLGAKGQVFGFDDYATCYNAVAMLLWQIDRVEGFATIIGSPTLNWEHPDVRRTLRNILTIDPDDIQKHLSEHNVTLLEYAREIYARSYGSRKQTAPQPNNHAWRFNKR